MNSLIVALLATASANYIGCFKDTQTRALPNWYGNGKITTVAQCKDIAQKAGATHYGMQYWRGSGAKSAKRAKGGQCFYGSTDYAIYGPSSDCPNTKAGGQIGGPWTNAIYSVGSPSLGPTEKVLFHETFPNGGFKEKWGIETAKWGSAPGLKEAGWQFGTGEIQNCTKESITFNGGKMQMTATALPDGTFNSGRIYTDFAVKPKAGSVIRVETRMQLPAGGTGIWPAFWMLPRDRVYGVWPKSGEIDIAEVNSDMSKIYTFLHHGSSINASPGNSIDRGFHTFALDWTLDSMKFSIDGNVYRTVSKSEWNPSGGSAPYDQEFYILFNLAIGGWAGNPPPSTVFPQVMTVEYVKVTEFPQ